VELITSEENSLLFRKTRAAYISVVTQIRVGN